MKFSEQWLREWVNPPVSTQELVEQLTMAGLEVDTAEPVAGEFSDVVVGEVLDVQPHPDADKLRVCAVDAGTDGRLQIVCGAPNVRTGLRVPAALAGATLPGGLKITKAKLRGVESTGMLCSARELGLSEAREGLMELPGDAPVGTDLRRYLSLDDTAIDIDLTPNRGDCLGLAGIAREVGVLNRVSVVSPESETVPPTIDQTFPVNVKSPAACPRYLGRVIRGINPAGTTPLWMQEKLRRSGIRSLGPVVDVTNYVLLELGQPMHAFDLDELRDGITVRMAKPGEQLVLLDERAVELAEDTLLIADEEKPLALAGIMGGERSGVSDKTTSLFLECAFFSPESITGRARQYALQTDSSYRFERGVDFELQHRAMERATRLLLEMVGGEAGPVIDVTSDADLPARSAIHLRCVKLDRLLGIQFGDDVVVDVLERLGMQVEPVEDGWTVVPPTFRFDMAIEVDLIEELGRVYGYDRIPSVAPAGRLTMAPSPDARVTEGRIANALVDRGYQEAITYSFVDPELQSQIDAGATAVELSNPISSEMSVMRTSLWPGLLNALQHNLSRQQTRVRLFEQGLKYMLQDTEIKQIKMVSGTVSGNVYPEQWQNTGRATDFYDAKSDVEALLALGGQGPRFSFSSARHSALHPGRSAQIARDGKSVGWIGNLHPALAKRLDLPDETVLFELEMAAITQGSAPEFRELSKYPSVRRDLAIVIDEATSAEKIREIALAAGGEKLRELRIFDVYQGKGIETGLKSIALGLILQDSSRTLTDKDVDGVIARVATSLKNKLGASLRE